MLFRSGRVRLGRGRYVRLSPTEKMEAIRMVEQSDLPWRRTLEQLGIHRSTFTRWYNAYLEDGRVRFRDAHLAHLGKAEEAERWYRQALDARRRILGTSSLSWGRFWKARSHPLSPARIVCGGRGRCP